MSGKSSTTKAAYPKWMKPYMREIAGGAAGLYKDPRTQMIPDLNPYTTQAFNQRAQIAQSGNTVGGMAADEAQRVLSGQYLDVTGDPRFQRNINEALGMTANRFANSGRVGSGAYAGAMSDAATGVAAEMYDAERSRMMQALEMSPQLIGAQYADSAALEDAGRAFDEDAMARFDWPYARLDRYANTIYGANAGGQKTKSPFDWMAMVTGLLNPAGSMGK